MDLGDQGVVGELRWESGSQVTARVQFLAEPDHRLPSLLRQGFRFRGQAERARQEGWVVR